MLEVFVFILMLFCVLVGMWRRGIMWFLAAVAAAYELYILTGSAELVILSFIVILAALLSMRRVRR